MNASSKTNQRPLLEIEELRTRLAVAQQRLQEANERLQAEMTECKAAEKSGLGPDKWFNNVEVVTAQKIGIETTTYVRNIYKYYVAYKLMEETREAARKAREQVAPGTGK